MLKKSFIDSRLLHLLVGTTLLIENCEIFDIAKRRILMRIRFLPALPMAGGGSWQWEIFSSSAKIDKADSRS